jgi:hypothetical protein
MDSDEVRVGLAGAKKEGAPEALSWTFDIACSMRMGGRRTHEGLNIAYAFTLHWVAARRQMVAGSTA